MHWSGDISLLFQPLRELSRYVDDEGVRVVLAEGSAELVTAEYDNWNGGTTYYSLVIRVPVPVYARFEDDLERIEAAILKKIERQMRSETHDFIREVLVQSTTKDTAVVIPPSECRFWKPGFFRLFISHVSINKVAAHNLKTSLNEYGICAFVAHDDIEVTKEWRDELWKALFSMDAMAAILDPSFGKSEWTDQEVGIALGRGKLVLPILYGRAPYGLLGKYQGLPGKGKFVNEVCDAVFHAILKHSSTSERLISCLAEQISQTDSIDATSAKLKLLDQAEEVPSEDLSKIREAASSREEWLKNDGFLSHLNEFLSKRGEKPLAPKRSQPQDDEIPF